MIIKIGRELIISEKIVAIRTAERIANLSELSGTRYCLDIITDNDTITYAFDSVEIREKVIEIIKNHWINGFKYVDIDMELKVSENN